jgi:hypothetical protein
MSDTVKGAGQRQVLLAHAILISPHRVIAIGFISKRTYLSVQMGPFGRLGTMSLPAGAVFFKYC